MPKNWNGHLIVFAHGGPHIVPPTAATSQPDLAKCSIAVRQGFAGSPRPSGAKATACARLRRIPNMLASSLSTVSRNHAARSFTARPGAGSWAASSLKSTPKARTVARTTMARSSTAAPLPVASLGYEFRADLRVVYQYYCKNLPRPNEPQYPLMGGVPAGVKITLKGLDSGHRRMHRHFQAGRGADRTAEAESRQYPRRHALSRDVSGSPHAGGDASASAKSANASTNGRSAFSNVGVRYSGSSNDDELNRNVVALRRPIRRRSPH